MRLVLARRGNKGNLSIAIQALKLGVVRCVNGGGAFPRSRKSSEILRLPLREGSGVPPVWIFPRNRGGGLFTHNQVKTCKGLVAAVIFGQRLTVREVSSFVRSGEVEEAYRQQEKRRPPEEIPNP